MKILKTISWNTINEYLNKGLLIKQKHPTKDLFILNYSKTCQYEKAWDEITLSCRGLVVDINGNIVARPFSKFFNKEELELDGYFNNDFIGKIPNLPFEVFEKLDGSLGIMFYYDNEWIFASRGSFTSEQAIKGTKMLSKKDLSFLSTKNTYIFEIIYPENVIVVNYNGLEDLILLGVIETYSGAELSYEVFKKEYGLYFTIVNKYDGINDFNKLKELNFNNKEGFVVKFSNNFRMKVKFDEYCRLHSIVTNVSNKTIWEYLRDDLSFEELLDRVPDEFYSWVEKTKNSFVEEYNKIETDCLNLFASIKSELNNNFTVRKEFALKAKDSKYRGILFNMYDGKQYSKQIWEMVKCDYQKPFLIDEN